MTQVQLQFQDGRVRIPDVLAQGYLEPIMTWLDNERVAEAAARARVDHAIYEHVATWML